MEYQVKLKAPEDMTEKGDQIMIKYEHRKWYDSHGTGNYTEDKSERLAFDVTEEKAKKFIWLWLEIGAKHYETSKAHFYEVHTDARHFTQYILYK